MEIAKCVFVAFAFLILGSNAVPEYRRVLAHYGDEVTAYEDVMIDEEAELIVTTVAKVSSKKFTPSMSFHDFSMGYTVNKLVEKGVCYISKNKHSIETLIEVLNQAERDNGDYEIRQIFKCTSKTFVEPSEMQKYGERIAAFCKEYESVFVVRDYKMRSKRETWSFEENAIACNVCIGICG
ncbi:uncharacterized protein LOC132751374 [Ruditapes philippinarum]|uniref:uncharacterized protein LOC132751374 n=1 Tax=Ruditapes philippinarum TaxID=129788 RepID=UPI00295C1F77|nr:uncharacterized protein LOC132751374 [Ruditapes philippinarum]